jgi:hypothetical protein
MLCYRVSVNGEEICVAGSPDDRVLTAIVTKLAGRIGINIGGTDEDGAHLVFRGKDDLRVGDRLLIELIEGESEPPKSRGYLPSLGRRWLYDIGSIAFVAGCVLTLAARAITHSDSPWLVALPLLNSGAVMAIVGGRSYLTNRRAKRAMKKR